MQHFVIENQGIQTFLVYNLEDDDIIDEVCYDMIHDNQIPGILPTFLSSADGKRCLKFNISSRISLEQFFNGVMNRNGFLCAFSSIVNALNTSNDYKLQDNYFLLDSKYIYVNVGTKEAELICIPILHTVEPVDMVSFFKNIVFQTQFDPSENASYVAKIIHYLDRGEPFTIEGLKKKLEEIIEENEPGLQVFQAGRAKTHPVNFKHAAQPEPAQADWEGPVADDYLTEQNEFAETSVLSSNMLRAEAEQVKKETSPSNEGDKKKGKYGFFNLFTGKKAKKQESQETEVIELDESIPVSFECNEEEHFEQNVMEEESLLFTQAYLNRVKTRERISINKQVFKIGKERSFVDYCIIDNPTISRSHANIVMDKNEYYIIDMNSKNHTYVNGRMIHSGDKVKLIHGSKIMLSNEEFEFYLQS